MEITKNIKVIELIGVVALALIILYIIQIYIPQQNKMEKFEQKGKACSQLSINDEYSKYIFNAPVKFI